jgi:hypothetical protein
VRVRLGGWLFGGVGWGALAVAAALSSERGLREECGRRRLRMGWGGGGGDGLVGLGFSKWDGGRWETGPAAFPESRGMTLGEGVSSLSAGSPLPRVLHI